MHNLPVVAVEDMAAIKNDPVGWIMYFPNTSKSIVRPAVAVRAAVFWLLPMANQALVVPVSAPGCASPRQDRPSFP